MFHVKHSSSYIPHLLLHLPLFTQVKDRTSISLRGPAGLEIEALPR